MDAVLIVDDSITTVVSIQKLIKETFPKMKILMASTGDEALKIVESSSGIVLALIDYHMEDLNGLELMKKLKKKLPKTNMVIVTGDDTPELKKNIEKSGAKILPKPLTKEGLLSVAPKS